MNKLFIGLIIFFCFITEKSFSQNFSGKIIDKEGQPLYGATIYIHEKKLGLVCDENGDFQTTLDKGTYVIEYRCLGYKSRSQTLEMNNDPIFKKITLDEEFFQLKEITITNSEDPAYAIIRKTIQKAPYFQNIVRHYLADIYIKANMELDNVSKIVNKISSVDGLKMSDLKNQIFVQESYNELEFTAPDKYEQTIHAFSSSIPDNFDPKESFGIITSSLYSPLYNNSISPLNPDAFSYYNFRYEGFIEENNEIINKIKFNAKYNDPVLFNGYLYISDNTWNIRYAELSKDVWGFKQNYIITYEQVKPEIYLPISYSLASTINTLGIKGYFNYFSSIRYKEVETNENVSETLDSISKNRKKLEMISDSLYQVKTDSLASKRDSAFWSKIRTIPLAENEYTSLEKKDSIQKHIDSIRFSRTSPRFKLGDLILGGQIGRDSSKVSFRYDGLLLAVPEYNFVDGAWIGQKIYVKTRIKKNNDLEISPFLYYTWGRNKFIYGSKFDLNYAPLRGGLLNIMCGSTSEDFNPYGITRFDNFISSAMYRENYNFFYLKDFISLKNNIDLTNGLQLETKFEIAKRTGTTNHANWGIWGDKTRIKPNIYSDSRFDVTSYSVALSYARRSYYSIKNGKKKYEKIISPVFSLRYEEGFSSWQVNNSRYRVLSGEIKQNLKLNYFAKLDYNLNGGRFFGSTKNTHFTDYHHFNTSNMFSISKWPQKTLVLLDNYEASTNKFWLQGNINYENRYLLLKRLSFLQSLPITENIHFKTLYTPDFKLYSEIGYSVDLLHLLNFGVHASFRKGQYERFGFRLSYILRDIIKAL